MNSDIWTRVKDTLQILIIPTLIWSLWVSRAVEVLNIKLQQQEAQLNQTRSQVESINQRAADTERRLVKIETTLDSVQKSIDRIERLVEKISSSSAGGQCTPPSMTHGPTY
jgi:septal ring factor EnvC (AmiA/AmiB activator)